MAGSGPRRIHSYMVRNERGWDQLVLPRAACDSAHRTAATPRAAGRLPLRGQAGRALDSESRHGTAPWPGLLGAERLLGPPVSLGLGSLTWEK